MTTLRVVIEGTPGWVTLVSYAISGLLIGLAAIGGGLVAANRDDKRWQRERDREGERWKREDERQWLVDRREAYAGLYAAVQAWDAILLHSWSLWKVDGRVEDDFTERRAPVRREFQAALGLVDLLAPEPIRRSARMVQVVLDYTGDLLRQDDTTQEKVEDQRAHLFRAKKALLRLLREDLGIVDVEPQSGKSTPAPPKIVT